MAHERLPDFLLHPGFEQSGIECMAQVMKSEVAQSGSPQCSFPRRLDPADRLLVERKDNALGFAAGFKVRKEPFRKRYLLRL